MYVAKKCTGKCNMYLVHSNLCVHSSVWCDVIMAKGLIMTPTYKTPYQVPKNLSRVGVWVVGGNKCYQVPTNVNRAHKVANLYY